MLTIFCSYRIYLDFCPSYKTLNSAEYHKILVRFVRWLAKGAGLSTRNLRGKEHIIQQDDAPCHGTVENLRYLCGKFHHVITRLTDKAKREIDFEELGVSYF